MPIKITFDKMACIGCGVCSSVCENWVMEGDKARPNKTDISKQELKSNKEAEEICPVKAITIEGG